MTAAYGVYVVNGLRIVRPVGGLSPGLCAHGIAVAQAQLGGQEDVGTVLLRQERGTGAGPAAANHQHVDVVVDSGEVHLVRVDPAVALEEIGDLIGGGVALVGANGQRAHLARHVVGVVALQQWSLGIQR